MKFSPLLLLLVSVCLVDLGFSDGECVNNEQCYSEDRCRLFIQLCYDDIACECWKYCPEQLQAIKDDIRKTGGCYPATVHALQGCIHHDKKRCFGEGKRV